MNRTFVSPVVTCRPALARDYEDVREFCKTIWDGQDYIPEVWDHWFRDPSGILAVAECKGHTVGCAKVTLLAEGQWWLEGFRVDPAYQGLKIGSHIHDYVDGWWLQNGNGVARLMTSAKNVHVQHLCEKLGYIKTGEAVGYIAPPLEDTAEDLQGGALLTPSCPPGGAWKITKIGATQCVVQRCLLEHEGIRQSPAPYRSLPEQDQDPGGEGAPAQDDVCQGETETEGHKTGQDQIYRKQERG